MSKFDENNLPAHIKPLVVHLHAGNSSRKQRHGKQYRTIARLLDIDTNIILGYGEAECSDKDAPSRKLGRQIAVGRAFKQLQTRLQS